MIRIAKAAGLKVIQASCYELPFNNAYFDAAYSIHMDFGFCRSMYDMKMLSKELFRVLAKQGIILLDTPHAKTKGKEYLTSWMAKDELVSAMSYGKTKEEIMEVLTDAGFVDISFYGFYNFGSQLHDDSRRIIVVAEKP
jgi:predicted SAM-dependent methyltransferase